jgi:hypothetical protein
MTTKVPLRVAAPWVRQALTAATAEPNIVRIKARRFIALSPPFLQK